MNAVEIKHLTKKYKELTAVKDLSMTINEGEMISLLGMNGAGKTTTLKMLSCLAKPTDGDALVFGKSILTDQEAVKQMIGISPQENSAAKNLTVLENLQFMCGIYGISKERQKENIERITADFSLGDRLNTKAGKLSGGWQKRLSIAMALITEPKVLFLDEPTLGLDVVARRELWHVIESLKGKVTIILTTHYMEESENLADRIAIMKDGALLEYSTLSELREKTGEQSLEEIFLKLTV